jgi:hypothetical protein
MEVQENLNKDYVGGGHCLDRVQVIYAMQLGLPDGVRVLWIVASKDQWAKYVSLERVVQVEIANANSNANGCIRKSRPWPKIFLSPFQIIKCIDHIQMILL